MSTKTVDAAQISEKLLYLVGILKSSPTHGALARRWAAELNKLLGSDDQSIAFRGDERLFVDLDAVVRAVRDQMPWRRTGKADPTPADIAELARLADLLACALVERRWPLELRGISRKLVIELWEKPRSFDALLNTIWSGKDVQYNAIERAVERANASILKRKVPYTISIKERFATLEKLTKD